jgi:gamma-glutamylcysteine synthetase
MIRMCPKSTRQGDAGARGRRTQGPRRGLFRQDERQFLTALRGIVESGVTPAEEKLALFHGRWRGRLNPVFAEFAY